MEGSTARFNRQRLIRTLTFWLRPAFALRVVNRFQRISGFDRSVALASGALTATTTLAIIFGPVLDTVGGYDIGQRIVARYDLSGGGAAAVEQVFAAPGGEDAGGDIFSVVFLLISMLSFTRAVQRLFEQVWDLKPLSVRNTPNGLRWSLALTLYLGVTGLLHAVLGRGRLEVVAVLVTTPVTYLFFVWSGRVLSAQRIAWAALAPFAAVATALTAIYTMGSTFYLPRLFNSYATRYGSIGAIFAMLTAFFCAMVVIVASAAVGREVGDELLRISRGERPADDVVRRQWDVLVDDVRSRWRTTRERMPRRTAKPGGPDDPGRSDRPDDPDAPHSAP
ncbi:hypothetical protein [Kitasatospora sp. NPDC059571]|uniref:hypothetical protein n=1 Tax=Kitasatospora sp. NPDC059571 TaxID=3346871 RepID=UPI0036AAFB55